MLKISKLQQHEIPQYRDLFQRVFNKPMSQELFTWKYINNPHQVDHDNYLIFIAKDGDKIIGARSLFPTIVYHGGQPFGAAQGGDTMVDQDYRGRGIFTSILNHSLTELRERGLNTLFNFPNQNSLPGNIQQGAKKHRDIISAVKILDWSTLVKRGRGSTRLPAPELPKTMDLETIKGLNLSITTEIDNSVDELVNDTFVNTDYVVQDRSWTFLNWRNAQYPNLTKTYRFLLLREGTALRGYAVLALNGNRMGEVTDYVVAGHDPFLFRILLKGAISWYKHQKATHIKTWYTYPQHKKILATKLFLPKKLNITFVTRFLEETPFAHAPWYITMGDTDTF